MYKFKIPEWAINYIYNSETEGITDEEIEMVDNFIKNNNVIGTSIIADEEGNIESYFSSYNAIGGLACNVYDCNCLCEIKPMV